MLARRKYKRLTAREVAKLATQPGMHPDGDGLYLQVSKTGAASWLWRYFRNGKVRDMGLGPLRHVSLAEARQLADAARKLRRDGIDPIEARRDKQLGIKVKTAKRMTFRQCAEAHFTAKAAGWSATHAKQWRKSLELHVHPIIGDLPVAAIDTGLVQQVLQPIWKTTPETASRVRSRIELILNWAATDGHRPAGEPNPARWRGHLENLLLALSKAKKAARQTNGKGEHFAALPYVEMGTFMAKLRQVPDGPGGIAARALEFAILCASRTKEVRLAVWSEIDFDEKMWTIPAERMKKGDKEHRVPLSPPAMAIIDRMKAIKTSDFVFPGRDPGKPFGAVALHHVLARLDRSDVTPHGFRSSFTDWCAECTAYPEEVRKMAIAHAIGDKNEEAYRRGHLFEKRRQLMAAWADYCGTLPEERGTVVSFAR